MKVALFDFDGTITSRDTMFEFLKFVSGTFKFYIGMVLISPMLFLYMCTIISAQKAKELMLSFFLKGMEEGDLIKMGQDFSVQRLPFLLKPKAISEINKYKSENYTVIVVTASLNIWTQKWCQLNGLDLISSLPEYKDKKFTGKLLGKNCNGEEKLIRIKEKLDLKNVKIMHGYGDSKGDLPMLSICQEKKFKIL